METLLLHSLHLSLCLLKHWDCRKIRLARKISQDKSLSACELLQEYVSHRLNILLMCCFVAVTLLATSLFCWPDSSENSGICGRKKLLNTNTKQERNNNKETFELAQKFRFRRDVFLRTVTRLTLHLIIFNNQLLNCDNQSCYYLSYFMNLTLYQLITIID